MCGVCAEHQDHTFDLALALLKTAALQRDVCSHKGILFFMPRHGEAMPADQIYLARSRRPEAPR